MRLCERAILLEHASSKGLQILTLGFPLSVTRGVGVRHGRLAENRTASSGLSILVLPNSERQPSFVKRAPDIDLYGKRSFTTQRMRSSLRDAHALANEGSASCDGARPKAKHSAVFELDPSDGIADGEGDDRSARH